jgi:hypothetical protein
MAATQTLVGHKTISTDGKVVAEIGVRELGEPEGDDARFEDEKFVAEVNLPGGEAWACFGESPTAALMKVMEALRSDARMIRRCSNALLAYVRGEDEF